MATRYWVGGTGNWDAATTTNWSATSGGAGGASVPTSSDDVIFDNSSSTANAAYTVTITATANCANFTMLGPHPTNVNKVTWAGSSALNIFGNMNLSGGTAGITRTYTGTITFSAIATGKTITCNGVTLAGQAVFSGAGGGWILQDTFDIGSNALTLTAGTLNTNGKTVNTSTFVSTSGSARVLTLGATNWTLSGSIVQWNVTGQGMILNSGTSTITFSNAGQVIFQGGNLAYYNVTIAGSSNSSIQDSNTFNNLSITGSSGNVSTTGFLQGATQTVSGTLTLNGNNGTNDRLLVCSQNNGGGAVTPGSRTNVSAASVSVSYADFQDIAASGAASWNISAATGGSGDCGGNTGITFTTPVDQHWQNASGGNWSTAANWTSRVPLPQDNVFMDKAFGTSQTVTANVSRLGKSIDWTGATWTTALTFTSSVAQSIFGSLTLISGLTYTGTTNVLTLAGRNSFTVDNKTVTIDQPITLNAPGGTYTMGANLTVGTTRTLTVTLGTFDTSSYVLSTGLLSLGAGGNGINATLNLNSATHLLTGTGTVFSATSTATTSVLNTGTSTLKVTDTSNTSITFANAKTLYNVWFARGASTATNSITQSGIYRDLKDDGSAVHIIQYTAGTVQIVTTFTVSGTAGNLITLQSGTAGSRFTLLASAGTINCDYLTIKDSLVGGGATWNAGSNSTFSTGNYFGTGFGWADAASTTKNRYWVTGGDGNWSNTNNWSTSSGGASGASVPIGEIVHFDGNSGAGTATINASVTCGDLDCTGFTGTLYQSSSANTTSVAGSLTLVSGMAEFNHPGTIAMTASGSSKTVDFASFILLGAGLTFTGVNSTNSNLVAAAGFGDTWTLSRSLDSRVPITLNSGTFDANNFNVGMTTFTSNNTNNRTIKLGSGTWNLYVAGSTAWDMTQSSQATIVPSTSTIKLNLVGATTTTLNMGGKTYYNLQFSGSVNNVTITGSNTFNTLTFDNLSARTVTIPAGGTNTVTSFSTPSNPGNIITFAPSTGTQSYIKTTTGSLSNNYLNLSGVNVIGSWYVGTNSVNPLNSNLTNVFFAAPSTVIAGQVTLSGTGVSGAIVRLIVSADNTEVGVTTTDGSGNYSFYADTSRLYHVCVEYETGGTKYNAKSLWSLTPA